LVYFDFFEYKKEFNHSIKNVDVTKDFICNTSTGGGMAQMVEVPGL